MTVHMNTGEEIYGKDKGGIGGEGESYLFYEIMVVVLLDTGEGNSRGKGGTGEGRELGRR